MTLYLKYRPQTLDELDLESVRDTLHDIIKSGNIPHAFLFSGPKGTGKTSAARILAKIINCHNLGKDGEPCNKCASCISITKGNNIDVIELDAASNRGIDDVRNLKEGIYLMPAAAKKKVYIIDEVHMLTLEAANAFLKTLEEPPDHVVFILATTNPEKLPATVISRLTQVNFTKATAADIARQLNRVALGEKIKISEKAIEKIAKLADGSFRDAVKIFESLSIKKTTKNLAISEKDVDDLQQNTANVGDFFEILLVSKDDSKVILEFIENQVKNGVSVRVFVESILDFLHKSLLAKSGIGEDTLANFTMEEILILIDLVTIAKRESSPVSQLPLEIAVVKFCQKFHDTQLSPGIRLAGKPPKLQTDAPTPVISTESEKSLSGSEKTQTISPRATLGRNDKTKTTSVKSEVKKEESDPSTPKTPLRMTKTLNEPTWQKLLKDIREKNVSIEALLRAATPINFDGKILSIGVYYQFHKDRLEDTKNIKILEDICKASLNLEYLKIDFELVDRPKETLPETAEKPVHSEQSLSTDVEEDIIDAAKEIFG